MTLEDPAAGQGEVETQAGARQEDDMVPGRQQRTGPDRLLPKEAVVERFELGADIQF